MMDGLAIGGIGLGTIFAAAFVAAIVFFLINVTAWSESDSENMMDTAAIATSQQNRKTKAEISYYAGVIAVLFLLTGMHSFVVAKDLL